MYISFVDRRLEHRVKFKVSVEVDKNGSHGWTKPLDVAEWCQTI